MWNRWDVGPVNRAKFNKGPWDNEPEDRIQWVNNGFLCLMVRNSLFGHWCGYIRILANHSWHGKSYYDIPEADVHGGVTYADYDDEGRFWIGFDCNHSCDMSPGSSFNNDTRDYRDIDYVRKQINSLVRQARNR